MTNPPRLQSVCPNCGQVFTRDSRQANCEDCRPKRDHVFKERDRGKTAARGYGARWQRLSKRAREMSPFCEDCGSPDDLTADHSVEAWRRVEAGKVIRLQDISVVCRSCNSERGAARGESASDAWRGEPLDI